MALLITGLPAAPAEASASWRPTWTGSLAFHERDHEIDGERAIAFDWADRETWHMLRWDGRRWKRAATPAAFRKAAHARISGPWVFGDVRGGTRGGTIHTWRVSGNRWSDHPIPGAGRLADAVATADGQAWVASSGGRIWRWDGASWARQDAPRAVSRLLAAGPGDIWALSADGKTPLHWDGGQWIETSLPGDSLPPKPKGGFSGACGSTLTEPAVEITDWATGAGGEVWASAEIRSHLTKCVGHVYTRLGDFALHWDGRQWRRVTPPAKDVDLQHVAIAASGDVVFTDDALTLPRLFLLREGRWRTLKPPRHLTEALALGRTPAGRLWLWGDLSDARERIYELS